MVRPAAPPLPLPAVAVANAGSPPVASALPSVDMLAGADPGAAFEPRLLRAGGGGCCSEPP
eukprot:COSAG06_NODE_7531_length_2469_cov_4.845992_1_plen_60_part_10